MHLDDAALDQIFRNARSQNGWLDRPVTDEQLKAIYDLAILGPTGANMLPMRLVFVKSAAAKERLLPLVSPGNVEKTKAAPVTAIVAVDREFYEHAPRLFPVPGRDMKAAFLAMPEDVRNGMQQINGSLQAAYLVIAARSLGLDAGPMGGFERDKVDAEFLAGTAWKSLLLVNLGYGDPSKLFGRLPRFAFEEAAKIV